MVGQSLCGEGRAICPHYYQLTLPTAVAELLTVTADTADHQVQLVIRAVKVCSSTPLQNIA